MRWSYSAKRLNQIPAVAEAICHDTNFAIGFLPHRGFRVAAMSGEARQIGVEVFTVHKEKNAPSGLLPNGGFLSGGGGFG